MRDDLLGKKAEAKIKQWLDHPELGYCFDRIPDQLSGFYGSKNICDFTLFKYPSFFYIESKASYNENIPFSYITDNQMEKMLEKSNIEGVYSIAIFLWAGQQRAFMFQISDIQKLLDSGGPKSLNIKKEDKWPLPHVEIPTIPSRKELLDYTGSIEDLLVDLVRQTYIEDR